MTEKEKGQIHLLDLERFRRACPRESQSWVEPIRRRALSRFGELGLPSAREEDWRQTNLAPLRRIDLRWSGPEDGAAPRRDEVRGLLFGSEAAAEIVFVAGHHAPDLSSMGDLPEGAVVESLADSIEKRKDRLADHLGRYADFETRSFAAWNTAFLRDGAFVFVPESLAIEKPIHLLYLSRGGREPLVAHPRSLILVEKGASATVVETYASLDDGTFLTNAVTEIRVGEGATFRHIKLQEESTRAFHVGALQAHQERSSRFDSISFAFGAGLARNDAGSVLDGEGAECVLDGLYLGRGDQLVDNHTAIQHARPHGSSRELYKGILTDRARGVFSGRIVVRPDAQKTDAKQTNQTLLLSAEAAVHTKPQLEIYADDVKCTHGATVGRLDENAVFYLRSRGIEEAAARSLLTYAFAADLVGRVDAAPLRRRLEEILVARLPQGEEIRGAL
ncbi:MAG: Fe-S cluster assembly protein SufD [Candidatus Eisenbacteria bacterium]|nr:Fe-S cluster assembly protein SufD [Candidatus Eisenbacteria bacterium]